MVLRQQPGEEHAVPVLIGHLVSEAIDLLGSTCAVARIAELAAVGPQAIA